jgi:hypothetical protein
VKGSNSYVRTLIFGSSSFIVFYVSFFPFVYSPFFACFVVPFLLSFSLFLFFIALDPPTLF